ncbi:MAG: twitching motility protein PilT [Defluviitaleaceae bacterium]|nr:twitching motility protein PilT [Defluviitaleaceae bacterium]
MRKLRLYLDTSTISHLYADDALDKMRDTNLLWEDVIDGKHDIFISPVVIDEVESCAEPKRSQMFERLGRV